jgi:dephospho-CoA kinase
MIIGITGTDGAGKGTVVDYLIEKKGYAHYSSRELLLEELKKTNITPTRNELRLMGNRLRAEYGDDVIVEKALTQIRLNQDNCAVVESIRAIAEAVTLKQKGAILLAIDADPHLRYERVQMRRSEKDQVTFEEFIAHEEIEKNDPEPHGMQKAAVIEMSDFVIKNDGTLEELHAQIEQFLNTYK